MQSLAMNQPNALDQSTWTGERELKTPTRDSNSSKSLERATTELMIQRVVLDELLDEAVAKLNSITDVVHQTNDESGASKNGTPAIISPFLSDD